MDLVSEMVICAICAVKLAMICAVCAVEDVSGKVICVIWREACVSSVICAICAVKLNLCLKESSVPCVPWGL